MSFQRAQLVPDLTFRQMLLATRSEAERMKQLAKFFPSSAAAANRAAPRNGQGTPEAG